MLDFFLIFLDFFQIFFGFFESFKWMQQQQRAVQCSRLSCAAAVWFGRHLLAAAPTAASQTGVGEKEEVKEMGGKEENQEEG